MGRIIPDRPRRRPIAQGVCRLVTTPDPLPDALVVSGDAAAIRGRLAAIRGAGVDEFLVTHIPIDDAAAEEAALAGVLAGTPGWGAVPPRSVRYRAERGDR